MERLTQCERVLRHLEDNGSLTAYEALKEYGIMHLASRITELIKDGVPIKKEMVTGKNRYGETTRYIKYILED